MGSKYFYEYKIDMIHIFLLLEKISLKIKQLFK